MLTASLTVDPGAVIGPVNRRLFGSFVEHLGRCVYDGIYEPTHPTADADGFRRDVIELVRELGVTTVRYPGGNFVSGFRWEDSVGPRESRPRRLDLAWHSTETNEVGLHEFAGWLDSVGAEPMLAINLGTRGVQEALDLLEYANLAAGTALTDLRATNGHPEPLGIRMWCLGNEMDGPWQLGHLSADDYGKLATKTASAMRQFDPSLELVACGSSSAAMPTFGEWERVVLGHAYDEVDYISCHAYYENRGDRASFLASGVNMDRFIETVVAAADHEKALRASEKTVNISFDEWNVWYNERYEKVDKISGIDNWPVAPRLLEDVYTVTDAVVVGSLLISLLKHADRVTSASLAQLVNVIAPIMTEPGGPAWRQTIFFPFAAAAEHARGSALRVSIDCPRYDTAEYGPVPVLDAVATRDPETGRTAVYVVNRSEEPVSLELDLGAVDAASVSASTLSDADPGAANTRDDQDRVSPSANESLVVDGTRVRLELPAISWTEVTADLA
ncbi:MAG: alpha-L-arabinofuranosidase [Microbacteriaceae bacterium]|nr:alpha-L-arabinofuranosidase [Microbacteriaceae bacterium]